MSSTSKCSFPSILPRPLNRSAYSARTCSSVRLLMLSQVSGGQVARCSGAGLPGGSFSVLSQLPVGGANPSSTMTNSTACSVLLHGFRMWTLAVPNTLSLDLE